MSMLKRYVFYHMCRIERPEGKTMVPNARVWLTMVPVGGGATVLGIGGGAGSISYVACPRGQLFTLTQDFSQGCS